MLIKVIGGRERPFKFSQYALEIFSRYIDFDALNSSAIYACVYAGLMGACFSNDREEPDFTFADVVEWIDKMYEDGEKETISEILKAWEQTFAYREWTKELNETLRNQIKPVEGKLKNKKKVRSTANGSRSTS